MAAPPHAKIPAVGWDVASVILAAIGLALFLLPILGIPVSCAGGLAGAIGVYSAWAGRTSSARLAFAGLLISIFAAAVELAIMFGPISYVEDQTTLPLRPVPTRPYVPPPAPARAEHIIITSPVLASTGRDPAARPTRGACHSERSEESGSQEILRCAQDDSLDSSLAGG